MDVVSGTLDLSGQHYGSGPLVVENKIFIPSAPGQTALTVTFPPADSIAETSVVIRNCCVKTGYAHGIHLNNCWNAIVDTVNIYGPYDGNFGNAISLQDSMDVRLSKLSVFHALTGLLIIGKSEGTVVSDSVLAGCGYGIHSSVDPALIPKPWLVVGQTHISSSYAGIYLSNRCQCSIGPTLLYRHPRLTVPGTVYYGIYVDPLCLDINIHDTTIFGLSQDSATFMPVVGQAGQFIKKDVFVRP